MKYIYAFVLLVVLVFIFKIPVWNENTKSGVVKIDTFEKILVVTGLKRID